MVKRINEELKQHSSFDISLLIGGLLSEIDFNERRWKNSERACKTRDALEILTNNPEILLIIIDKTPDDLRNAVCEMILLDKNFSITTLNSFLPYIALREEIIDMRIAEIAFLIRSDYIKLTNPASMIQIFELFPVDPSKDYHTARFVARDFLERNQITEEEYNAIFKLKS